MKPTGIAAFLVAAVVAAAPSAAAQSAPSVSLRPFVEFSEEAFTATQTFKAVFGRSNQPLWGGGLQVTFRDRVYVEFEASRFKKNGDRVFLNNGQVFHLGIPLTARLTPFEVTGGYRFHPWSRVIPYVGAGAGRYAYVETSQFADASENLDTRHSGVVVDGGAEFRLHRWIGVAADVKYTHVTGIFGQDGISKDVGETDLGGVAARFKVIVGR